MFELGKREGTSGTIVLCGPYIWIFRRMREFEYRGFSVNSKVMTPSVNCSWLPFSTVCPVNCRWNEKGSRWHNAEQTRFTLCYVTVFLFLFLKLWCHCQHMPRSMSKTINTAAATLLFHWVSINWQREKNESHKRKRFYTNKQTLQYSPMHSVLCVCVSNADWIQKPQCFLHSLSIDLAELCFICSFFIFLAVSFMLASGHILMN